MTLPVSDDGSGRPGKTAPRVFTFVDHYLPGSDYGGPVRTLANLAERLAPDYQFFIMTADRDYGAASPYENVPHDQWVKTGAAMVYYTARRSLLNIARQVDEISPDLIYLNSFFSRVTIKYLVARRLGRLSGIPVLLAPRGEFAQGALAIKRRRKMLYVRFAHATGLLRDVTLQASTEFEKQDIERCLEKSLPWTRGALVASDLPGIITDTVRAQGPRVPKQAGLLRIIFLARVSRNKNLDGALRMLRGLRGRVEFTICGPILDDVYWRECKAVIQKLPPNITINVMSAISHDKVAELLSHYDVLFLPTHGENFGHSIIEALTAGCPVVISDRTPWRGLEEQGVGVDLSLAYPEKFTEKMQMFTDMDNNTFAGWCERARKYGVACASSEELLAQNYRMFSEVLQRV